LIRRLWRELLDPEPEAMPGYTRDWGDVTGSKPPLAAARRNLIPVEKDAALKRDVMQFCRRGLRSPPWRA
jgi:hypothetical protein